MPSEFVTDFAEKLRNITEELGEIAVPEKFIKLAEEGNLRQIYKEFNKFQEQNSNLWQKILKLRDEYVSSKHHKIFGFEEEEAVEYDPDLIKPINLLILFVFTDGKLNDVELFEKYELFAEDLFESGYKNIARYLETNCLESFEALIEAVNYPAED